VILQTGGKIMGKPLKDWTLGEVQEHCIGMIDRDCDVCELSDRGRCTLCKAIPADWDLTDPPRFTPQETEDAKTLLRVFAGCYDAVYMSLDRQPYLKPVKIGASSYAPISTDMFQTLCDGETISLKEIAGYTE
jgi:hypothetical protein